MGGYILGWAVDDDHPWTPLTVSVRAAWGDVAAGAANRYRRDLAEAAIGGGWCAFSLRLAAAPAALRGVPLSLRRAGDGSPIAAAAGLGIVDDPVPALATIDQIRLDDPTVVSAIEQLQGCGALFSQAIALWGARRFVQIAHNYILDRPADETEGESLAERLQMGDLSPYALLTDLYDSPEFRASPRLLAAPTEPGFPFRPS